MTHNRSLLGAYVGAELMGTLRLTFGADGPFPAEFTDTYGMDAFSPAISRQAMLVVSRLAVGQAHRGTAMTFALIAEATRLAVRRRVELAFCDCQPHLINLYVRLGLRPYRFGASGAR